MSSNRGAYICLAVLFVLTMVAQGPFTVDAIRNITGNYPQRPILIGRPWPTIAAVNLDPGSAVLRPGQRVVAIEGRAPRGTSDLATAVRTRKPGDVSADIG